MEKYKMFGGQNMNYRSSGPEMQFSSEGSRKRKTSDLDVNFCNLLPHQETIGCRVGYLPPGNSILQDTSQVPISVNSCLPQAMNINSNLQSIQNSGEHFPPPFGSSYLNTAMHSNKNFKSSHGTEQQSQFNGNPACSISYANTSSQDINYAEMSTVSSETCKFKLIEPYANTTSQEVSFQPRSRISLNSPNVQFKSVLLESQTQNDLRYDQRIGFIDNGQVASESSSQMIPQPNSSYQPNKIYSSPRTHLPPVSSLNVCSDADGSRTLPYANATQQLNTINIVHHRDSPVDISIGTRNTAEMSALIEGKTNLESFQNSSINIMRSDGRANLTQKEQNNIAVSGPGPEKVELSSSEKNCVNYNSHSTVDTISAEFPSETPSLTGGNKNKPITTKVSLIASEKIWDGCLQLNASIKLSATAFFRSGEKAQGIGWPKVVEVKGKVRLPAFEKFIQELPRSRTRALMVISLCCKDGSSIAALGRMKEIAKGYKEGDRVGFAKICSGNDLYVCPRSETIITILAKYGFFKGMAAVEENLDSLIGCIVWHRVSKSSNFGPKRSERKETLSAEQILNSPGPAIVEANSPPAEKKDLNCQEATDSKEIEMNNKSSNHESTRLSSIQPIISSKPCNSLTYPAQVHAQQKLESTSHPEIKENMECSLFQAPERTTALIADPPPQVLSESHWRNIMFQGSSHRDIIAPIGFHQALAHPIHSAVPSVQLQAMQGPKINYQCQSTETAKKADGTSMHFHEANKPMKQTELSQITLPGPPPLPPEVLQRIIQSRLATKESTESMTKAEKIASQVAHPIKDVTMNGPLPSGPPLPLHRSLVGSSSVHEHDDDDLPDYDFLMECGNTEKTAGDHYDSSNPMNNVSAISNLHRFEAAKNHTLNGSNIINSVEVMESQHVSPLPGESFARYGEMAVPTSLQKDLIENYPAIQTPKSRFGVCTEADKITVGVKNSCPSPRQNRWNRDEDVDDMPEWCPPELAHIDRTPSSSGTKLTSTIHNFAPQISALDRANPFSSRMPFNESKSQGSFHSHQRGLLGPPPGNQPTTSRAQAIHSDELSPSEENPRVRPYGNNSFRRQANKYDRRQSSTNGRRYRGP